MKRILAIVFGFVLLAVASETVVMAAGNAITGRIYDQATGEPISRATVEAGRITDITGNNGRYRLRPLLRGTHAIRVSARDYMPVLVTVTLPEGEVARDFGLARARTSVSLSGTVKDSETGEPIRNAEIKLGAMVARSESNGVYHFASVDQGEHTLQVRASGYKNWASSIKVRDDRTVFNISLDPEINVMVIQGRIFDRDNRQPLRDATVHVGNHEVLTDSRGNFSVAGLPPGDYELKIRAFGFLPAVRKVEARDHRSTIDIGMSRIARKVVITGKVVDSDHMPVEGAMVKIGDIGSATDFNGEFRLLNISEGPQEIVCLADGFEKLVQKVLVAAGNQDIRLHMSRQRRLGELTLILRDRFNARPVTSAIVTLAGIRYQADEDGRIQVEQIPAGRYPLKAEAPGYITVKSAVDIDEGRQVMTVAMEAGAAEAMFRQHTGRTSESEQHSEKSSGSRVFKDIEAIEELGEIPETAASGRSITTRSTSTPAGDISRPSTGTGSRATGTTQSSGPTASGIATERVEGRDYGHLQGIITYADTSRGIAGVTVSVGERITETDNTGFYSIKFLSAGYHDIVAYHDTFGLFEGSVLIEQRLTNYNMIMDAPVKRGNLYGVVYDLISDEPLRGAVISVGDIHAVSDSEGAYILRGVKADYYRVSVEMSGYQPHQAVLLILDGEQRQDFFLSRQGQDAAKGQSAPKGAVNRPAKAGSR